MRREANVAELNPAYKLRQESKARIDDAVDHMNYLIDGLETLPEGHLTRAGVEALRLVRRRLIELEKSKVRNRQPGRLGRYTPNEEGRIGQMAYELRRNQEKPLSWQEIGDRLADLVEIETKQPAWKVIRIWARTHAAKHGLKWPIGLRGRRKGDKNRS